MPLSRFQGTTKCQVAAMFAEEKPILQPLPLEPFRSPTRTSESIARLKKLSVDEDTRVRWN
jgi:hypothetical protein